MLLTYTDRKGPLPFGAAFSIPLSQLKEKTLDFVVRYNNRDFQVFKLDFLFKEAENVEETLFLQEMLDNIFSHKKIVCMCVDREAQNLPYMKEHYPDIYNDIGGWLYEGQTTEYYLSVCGTEMCMWSIFHKLVFETAKDIGIPVREVRLELDSHGYYYTLYRHGRVQGTETKMLRVDTFRSSEMEEMVNMFLTERR